MNDVSPKVSVIIPCFNGERFIRDAINNVLEQTHQEFEIIVVDDGSSDGSKRVIDNFRSEPRLRYVEHGENRGIAAARNTGIGMSRGDLIAFLDQDDLWRPQKLERQMEVMEGDDSHDIGMVFTDVEVIEQLNGKEEHRFIRAPLEINAAPRIELLKAFFMKNFIPIISVMIRRYCFDEAGGFDERIRSGADDYELCFRLAKKFRLAHIAEPLAVKRVHGENYTDIKKLFPDDLMILGQVLEEFPEMADLRNRRLSDLYDKLAACYLREGELERAKKVYRQSAKYHRSNVKAYVGMLLSSLGGLGKAMARRWVSNRSI